MGFMAALTATQVMYTVLGMYRENHHGSDERAANALEPPKIWDNNQIRYTAKGAWKSRCTAIKDKIVIIA